MYMYTCIHVHNDELNTALLENLLYVAASCCVASTTFHAVYLRKVMGANMVRYFLAEVTRSLHVDVWDTIWKEYIAVEALGHFDT